MLAHVEVSGTFELTADDPAPGQFVFVLNRMVTPVAGGAPHPPSGSRTNHRIPGPDDVLAFEMPQVRVGGRTLPDRLSVRLRVVPLP